MKENNKARRKKEAGSWKEEKMKRGTKRRPECKDKI
jgi:hypothetical protein